jgi:hypothetical protein
LTRKTESILDEMRKSMAEYRREKKTSMFISPYHTSNDSATYSFANSNTSDKDSFSIYQRASYGPPSPIPSVYVNNAPLKSALKKSTSKNTLSISLQDDSNSIYGQGIDNLSYENDEENFKEEADNESVDEIEMYQRRRKRNDTYI